MSSALRKLEESLEQELGRVVLGLQAPVRALLIALVARGHVLLQGAPGLGKTLLAKSLARSLGGEFKRVQGTADLNKATAGSVAAMPEPMRRELRDLGLL